MKIINIKFEEIKVTGFSPKDLHVDVEVYFDDGSRKYASKSLKVGNHEDAATALVSYVRYLEKRKNHTFGPEDTLLSNYVNVVIEEESEVMKKIAMFLSKAFNMVESIKNSKSADGYLDKLNSIKKLSMKL